MDSLALIIFLVAYVGLAAGEIPGLALDRTGFALLGAVAMVATGVLSLDAAVAAVDVPTILLLYSLMVVSAQFRLGGFYTRVAAALARQLERPRIFLFKLMVVSALVSAILANDIVCLAFTPVVVVALQAAGRKPLPHLLGLAIASNIGSAATLIGNPQNMLIGQLCHLDFGAFTAWALIPCVISLLAAYCILVMLHRKSLDERVSSIAQAAAEGPAFNAWQTGKGIVITAALMVAFFLPIPRELAGLVAAGLLLCSRRLATRSLLGLIDWHLITLFISLFVIIAGLAAHGWPEAAVTWLSAQGIHLGNPYILSGTAVILSNLVSNVPAVMVLVKLLPPTGDHLTYILAVASTFAGNLLVIGSIANLITIEQARLMGVRVTFRDHALAGVPVTLATLGILAVWIGVIT